MNLNLTSNEICLLFENEDNDFLTSVYSLVRKYLHKYKYYNEDLVQDCVFRIFSQHEKFNSEKSKFTTWCCKVCENVILMDIRYKNAKKRQNEYFNESLNLIVKCEGKDIEFLDLIPDEIKDVEKKLLLEYIYDNLLSDLVKEYLNGVNQFELSKKYNVTQSMISRRIKKELNDIKIKLNL